MSSPDTELDQLPAALIAKHSDRVIHAPLRNILTQTFGGQIGAFPGVPGEGRAPTTFLTIVPIESSCTAVRVAYGNCFNFPVTILSASVYPSDSYSLAAETMNNGGLPVSVIPTVNGGLNSTGAPLFFNRTGVDRPNSGSPETARSVTLPPNIENTVSKLLPHVYEWSEWVECGSLPRADGATQPLLFIYTTIGSAGGTFVPANLRALNSGGFARGREHYGLIAITPRADFADNPAGTQFNASDKGQTSWNPVVALQYRSRQAGIQVLTVGDSLARSPSDDGFSNAVWRACADLSSSALPIACASIACGGGNPSLYNGLTRLNADALQPSIAALQVITRNGYSGHEDMRRLLRQMLELAAELYEQHGTRLVFNIPGGEPSWDQNADWADAFVDMRNNLLSAAKPLGLPVIDAPSNTAPANAPWRYSEGMSDDGTHLNSRGSERVVPLARAAIQSVVENEPIVCPKEAKVWFEQAPAALPESTSFLEPTKELRHLEAQAHAATANGDGPEALRLWQKVREQFPNESTGYRGAIIILREQQRLEEAEFIAAAAIEKFPDDPRLCVEWALLAHARRDWADAAQRWHNTRAKFPSQAAAYALGGLALRELGRHECAESLLTDAIELFPNHIGVANEYAWLATVRRDWPVALTRWERVRNQFPERPGGYTGVAMILRELRRFDDAEVVLAQAIERFPRETGPYLDHARIAHARSDWPTAAHRWNEVRRQFPDEPDGYVWGALALRQLGCIDEAEKLLKAASTRFPTNMPALIEYARLAHGRRDYKEATLRWQVLRTRFPERVDGYIGEAASLRESLRLDEAEALAAEAAERFRNDAAPLIELAMIAHIRRDLPLAVVRWQKLRGRFPHQVLGYTMGALDLGNLNHDGEAETVLLEGIKQLPSAAELWKDYARLAERRRRWAAAIERWEQMRTRFPDRIEGYSGGAFALSNAGRQEEGEQLLKLALARFPETSQAACDYAWAALRQHRWDDAEQRFAVVRERFPDDPAGYRGGAAVLMTRGRLDDAERMLEDGMMRVPSDPFIVLQHARIPASPLRREKHYRDLAISRLEALCARFQDFELGHIDLVRRLRDQNRLDEAEAAASRGLQQRTRSPDLGIEYARIAQDRGDWVEALQRYCTVTKRFPDQLGGFLGQVEVLAQLGRFDEAEALLDSVTHSFPAEPGPYAEHARLAMRRGEVAEALRRWAAVVRRFPGRGELEQEHFLARLRAAENDPIASAAVTRELSAAAPSGSVSAAGGLPPMRDLVCSFESLGGTLLGCEFGLFQRAYGAEPLGLLRWTDIEPDALVAALELEFEGVGLPEQTELITPEDPAGEYATRDRRFGMRMHTFLSKREMQPERMHAQACRRLKFLRDKLLADLKSAGKIFVYKITARNLTEDELHRVFSAIRRYSDNTLLYVRYSEPHFRSGTVEMTEPGLLIGYIDHFAVSASGDQLGAQTIAWTEICVEAYRLWRQNEIVIESARDDGETGYPARPLTHDGAGHHL